MGVIAGWEEGVSWGWGWVRYSGEPVSVPATLLLCPIVTQPCCRTAHSQSPCLSPSPPALCVAPAVA